MTRDIKGLVLDFDGTLSTGAVFVNDQGNEMVQCSRSDSYGIHLCKKEGIEIVVITAEVNDSVLHRCNKMGIERIVCGKSPSEKFFALEDWANDSKCKLENIAFVGNDLNDLACISHPDIYSFAVGDAHPQVKKEANYVLHANGGYGAVREACELIIDGKI